MKNLLNHLVVPLMIAIIALVLCWGAVSAVPMAQVSPLESPLPTLEDCYADCHHEAPEDYLWACEKSCRCALRIDTACSITDYENERPCPPPHAERLDDWMGLHPLWIWIGADELTHYCVEGGP